MFIVYGKPQGKARARTFYNKFAGRVTSFTPQQTVLYENLVKTCFQEANEKTFFNGEPITVQINAYFAVPKSKTKREKTAIDMGEIQPTKKPDADNIAKVICDALNGIAYRDDTQVISLKVRKVYIKTLAKDQAERVEVSLKIYEEGD